MHHDEYSRVTWTVNFHPDFAAEADGCSDEVKVELAAMIALLETVGPQLKRPHADTLNSTKMKNLKELRFKADHGVWRIAYAFDPARKAILLCGGDKSGISQKLFYDTLTATAEKRYADHLRGTK